MLWLVLEKDMAHIGSELDLEDQQEFRYTEKKKKKKVSTKNNLLIYTDC